VPAAPLATDRPTNVPGHPAAQPAGATGGRGRSSEPPGTLLWIGPTRHPEFVEAFRFCRDRAGQIAVRANLRAASRRPAGHVQRVIFALPDRSVPPADLWAEFLTTQVTAGCEVLALGGSLCDGRGRSGEPWPGGPMLRFSRWEEFLPRWLAPCGVRPRAVASPRRGLLVLCDRFETAEPWLAAAQRQDIAVAWHRRFIPVLHAGFDLILWDDSVAPPASADAWTRRRSAEDSPRLAFSRQDVWLSLQPTSDDIRQALSGGIARVLTKPVAIDAVFGQDDLVNGSE
jgi:hypothetical protein